jgi:hypothetical protein
VSESTQIAGAGSALVIYDAGRVIGMLMRHTAADYEVATESPGLTPEYRDAIKRLAVLRRELLGESER